MPTVPANQLQGTFTYTIRGLMRAQNLGNQNYIPPPATPVDVGLGGPGFFPNAQWPKLPEWGELPVMTAFYNTEFPAPPPPAKPKAPSAGTTPYTPDVGYYPFSEIGVMLFDKGSVSGVMRVNMTGYADGQEGPFHGKYRFDSTKPSIGLPVGMITIQLDPPAPTNHFWDYAFTMVSKKEVLLAASGRLPRPAVGTGTMRKVDPGVLTWR